jgi:hypothetical protein
MTSSVVSNEMYVILGASGNTGSIIANSLLSAGKKVRVVGRKAGRLQRFLDKGAEAFTADLSDAAALTKAFSGARAAYLLLPPAKSREDQEKDSDAIAKAVKESGLGYAVHLSSYGAQVPEGTGPVAGLHSSEQKLNAISGLNVLQLRAAYFMENNLAAIGMIHRMGIFGNALRLLEAVATSAKKPLAKTTISHFKAFLSRVFFHARNRGFYRGENPVTGTEIPSRTVPSRETGFYTLAEIRLVLPELELAHRAAVAVAAYAGLRLAEIQGLSWPDYDGDDLSVNETEWRGHRSPPKSARQQKLRPGHQTSPRYT